MAFSEFHLMPPPSSRLADSTFCCQHEPSLLPLCLHTGGRKGGKEHFWNYWHVRWITSPKEFLISEYKATQNGAHNFHWLFAGREALEFPQKIMGQDSGGWAVLFWQLNCKLSCSCENSISRQPDHWLIIWIGSPLELWIANIVGGQVSSCEWRPVFPR